MISTRIILLIGAGGFAGSALRYILTVLIQNRFLSIMPYGTLTVNVAGCFIAGLIFSLAEKFELALEWRLLLLTGFCGGFTTFSAFSLESVSLIRAGEFSQFFLYTVASLLLGIAATVIGVLSAKVF